MDESWENLAELWTNTEKILYIISNKIGEIPRHGFNKNAKPLSKDLEDKLNSPKAQTEEEGNIRNLLLRAEENRYYGINFKPSNTADDDKSTIEFRLSNGTLDSDTWIENINLFGGIVKAAENIAIIQKKFKEERTEEEQNLLNVFEKLKQEELSDCERLEILLTLVIPEEDRETYRKRYEVNSELLEKSLDVKEEITRQLAEKTINIREIGKKVFLGENGVTGQEYRDGNPVIEMALRGNEKERSVQ